MSPHQSNATRFYDFRQLFMFKVKETFLIKDKGNSLLIALKSIEMNKFSFIM